LSLGRLVLHYVFLEFDKTYTGSGSASKTLVIRNL
jgi:hypothetical protein